MTIPSTHWSKDRKTYGVNIPEDLPVKTLDDVQEELAEAGLEVERGETQVIVSQEDAGGICVGSIVRFPNGDLQSSTRKTQVRSSDGGKTWSKVGKSLFGNYACNLSDGETVQFASRTGHGWEVAPPDEVSDVEGYTKSFGWLVRSRDSGVTEEVELVPIHVPKKLKLTAMHHTRIIELDDGSLIAADYGSFEGDGAATLETWCTKEGVVWSREVGKSRTFVIHSTDRGKTWHYLSTVAFDLSRTNTLTVGGFTEPDAVILPNGEVLCFMRCVAGGTIRPLRMSRSNDGGETWSMPMPVADRGVMAVATVMENGVIAVIYGRPYNWLMFSTDEGHTWVGHFQFYHGAKAWDAWNYCAVEEVGPDTLLAVYGNADPDDVEEGEQMATFFTVKRKS